MICVFELRGFISGRVSTPADSKTQIQDVHLGQSPTFIPGKR